MNITTTESRVDYINLVKTERRDWFLAAMFLPEDVRKQVIAIYALDIELAHVHHMVKEEMMGHIRYAWWQENIEALANPKKPDHPLLQLLAGSNITPESLLPVVTSYRESFPEYPENSDKIVMNVVKDYMLVMPAKAGIQFNKATAIITTHRKKYWQKYTNWLLVKLLFI